MMPIDRKLYATDSEYHNECMRLVNKAQNIYNKIQKMEPTQALINNLGLTAAQAAST